MSASFVVDCSVAMSWCFPDEATAETTRLLDRLETETALVPAHWFLEVTNVLAMAEKRRRLASTRSDRFLSLLETLEFDVDVESPGRAFAHLLPLCRAHRLTAYDAVYLDLATRRRLPLATLDDDLRTAAKALGVTALGK